MQPESLAAIVAALRASLDAARAHQALLDDHGSAINMAGDPEGRRHLLAILAQVERGLAAMRPQVDGFEVMLALARDNLVALQRVKATLAAVLDRPTGNPD